MRNTSTSTYRLLPLLRRNPPFPPAHSSASQDSKPPSPPSSPRIISLTSTLHTAASPTVLFLTNAELSRESSDSSSPLALFARAALSAVLFTKRLALQLSFSVRAPGARPLLALAVDPGPVHSRQPEQYKEAFGYVLGSAAQAVMAPFERAPGEACLSTLWAATAREVEDEWENWQGAYVAAPGMAGGESTMARDEERGQRLWAMSESLIRQRLRNDALYSWTQ